jgi:uridine kinase
MKTAISFKAWEMQGIAFMEQPFRRQSKQSSRQQSKLDQRIIGIIGISGGSGSGKTTLARELFHHFGGQPHAAILSQDSYYIDQSSRFVEDGGTEVNFDHPESIEFSLMAEHLQLLKAGQSIEVPQYDFVTHTRRPETQTLSANRIILVDGTLLLSQPLIRAELDESVFIAVDEAIRFERRLHRDVNERGRKPEGVLNQFLKQVKPMHDQFVDPSKEHAGLCLLNPPEISTIVNFVLEKIALKV